jgi:glutamate synthase (NADPH/NADH) small chain
MIKSGKLSALEYEKNFSDIHPPFYTGDAAGIEANRCLFCYDAPCIKACPTSINVPKFIKQISTNNIQGSAKTIFDSNIMGAACAKVCPVEKLCEGACVYNLMEEEPISIAKLQRFSTEKAITQQWPLYTRKPNIGKKIAVVGAGPAGLP